MTTTVFKSFILSRIIRLQPVYICCLLLTILLWYLSSKLPGFQGTSPKFSSLEIITNITLTAGSQSTPWIMIVAWTLAIEMQFYLLIAITYPIIKTRKKSNILIYFSIWLLGLFFTNNVSIIFSWSPLFLIGTLGFLKHEKSIDLTSFIIGITLLFLIHSFTKSTTGSLIGILTILAILYSPSINSTYVKKIGVISYSLYLIHVPIGGRVINLLERTTDNSVYRVVIVIFALAVSILAANFFYTVIEKKSHQLSRKQNKPTN